MTARIVITCDAVHPERTPPECRAFLATKAVDRVDALLAARRSGWDVGRDDERDICPSCRQKEAQ